MRSTPTLPAGRSQGAGRPRGAARGERVPAQPPWLLDGLCVLAVVALCLAIGAPRYRHGIDLGDEGFLAYGAVRVMEGQLPSRDFWSLQPPSSFYVLAAVFSVLGTSLASLRLLGLALFTLIPVLVYGIARQRAGRLVAMGAAVPAALVGMPVVNFVPLAMWQGATAALIAAFCIMRAAVTGRRAWSLGAGVATAATIVSRHDQGFYIVVAIVTYLLALWWIRPAGLGGRPRALLGSWLVGTAAPLLALGLWWLAAGAIPAMVQQLALFPLTTYVRTSSTPMPVFTSFASLLDIVYVALFYLPPVVLAAAGAWLSARLWRRSRDLEDAHLAFVLALAALFYLQVLTRSDLIHLVVTLDPFFVICAWAAGAGVTGAGRMAERWGAGSSRAVAGARGAVAAVLVLGAAVVIVPLRPLLFQSTAAAATTVGGPRGGVHVEPRLAQGLEHVVTAIQTHAPPGTAILSLPYSPMIYFLAERRNPTGWNYLWPGDQTVDDHRALIEQARRDPPAVVTLMETEESLGRYAGPIVDYIRATFRLAQDLGGLKVYLPAGRDQRR